MGCNLDPVGHAATKEIGMPRESLLAQTLVDLADSLVDDFDVVELLTLLTDRCVEVLSVAAAGIMLVSAEGELGVMASSNEATRVLELFELQCQEGPCLDCYRSGAPIIAADLTSADGRWPHFAVESLSAGFRSVHALPMRLRGTTIGALNLFRQETGTLDELRAILGNSIAIKAYRDTTLPFPDGTTLVKLAWKHVQSTEFAAAFVPGAAMTVQVMVKDSKKYAATDGWGFADFTNGKPGDEALHQTCYPCHLPVKDRDFVFAHYATTP